MLNNFTGAHLPTSHNNWPEYQKIYQWTEDSQWRHLRWSFKHTGTEQHHVGRAVEVRQWLTSLLGPYSPQQVSHQKTYLWTSDWQWRHLRWSCRAHWYRTAPCWPCSRSRSAWLTSWVSPTYPLHTKTEHSKDIPVNIRLTVEASPLVMPSTLVQSSTMLAVQQM